MDEMSQLSLLRAEVPEPDLPDLRAEEERLMAAIAGSAPARRTSRRTGRRVFVRIGVAGGLSAAAVAAVVAVSVDSAPRPSPPGPVPTSAAPAPLPKSVAPVAVVQTLDHAAEAALHQPELHPRPGQFLVFRSQSMEQVESNSRHGYARYLSNTRRTIWLPVSGDATGGVDEGQVLPPKAYPGWPIPPEARTGQGSYGPDRLVDYDGTADYLRTDYTHLSRLPTDTAGMRQHLYYRAAEGVAGDRDAWQRVGSMLTNAYMPTAQRAALFRAAATIPGVKAVASAKDAVGREGVAVAMTDPGLGTRQEYIFDRNTYLYLGARTVIVNAAKARGPKGGITESTAQLSVQVADKAPRIKKN
ncbi:CU044_5270 family protein [Actinoallomurus sp. NBC_01490]|uniref:CU044_5270 family protein n=1 Tax=Actinoallomurus sp. NBC_01490 TaxID=2903557 RepID=UPI002E36B9FA|nr:CU044_5270 family protein [Actinoallomurus sp. NBC_01490]